MNQSKIASLIEAIVGTIVGFLSTLVLAPVVYPLFGHAFTLAQNLGISAVFTVISVARGYIVRRWFNTGIKGFSERMASRLRPGGTPAARQYSYAELQSRHARLLQFVAFVREQSSPSGVCCCGSPVDKHGWSDNHSPVDMWGYTLTSWLKELGMDCKNEGCPQHGTQHSHPE